MSGEDCLVDFELSKHAFDAVALLVESPAMLDFGRQLDLSGTTVSIFSFGKVSMDCVGIVALVGEQGVLCARGCIDQGVIGFVACRIAERQMEVKRSAEGICQVVTLTGEPLRERPERVDESQFSVRCRDVGIDCGPVDARVATVRHDLCQRHGDGLPISGFTPSQEPAIDSVPAAIFRRHFAPWSAAAEPPKDAVDDGPVLLGRPASSTVLRLDGQQALQNAPFRLTEIAPAQACLQKAGLNQSCVVPSTPAGNFQSPAPLMPHNDHFD